MKIKLMLSRLLIRFPGTSIDNWSIKVQLSKAITTDLYRSPLYTIANGFVSSKIYDKRDDIDFDIVKVFRFWMVTFFTY